MDQLLRQITGRKPGVLQPQLQVWLKLFLNLFNISSETATATARKVLPVPAGPIPKVKSIF